tara:strand:+ start:42 stop:308 length:267 start_codon:yes stop_codon:yes gene_type:complete
MVPPVWLVVVFWVGMYDKNFSSSMEKFPMETMEQCERAKTDFIKRLAASGPKGANAKLRRPLPSGTDYDHKIFCMPTPPVTPPSTPIE